MCASHQSGARLCFAPRPLRLSTISAFNNTVPTVCTLYLKNPYLYTRCFQIGLDLSPLFSPHPSSNPTKEENSLMLVLNCSSLFCVSKVDHDQLSRSTCVLSIYLLVLNSLNRSVRSTF